MSGEPFDWRAEEKLSEVEAAQRTVAAILKGIEMLEREVRIRQGAQNECRDDIQAMVNQQFALRRLPGVAYTDADGFEQVGAAPETRREYDRLADAIKAREAEYQRWVDARRQYTTSIEWWLGRRRVALEVAKGELRALVEELPPGLRLRFEPAPDYTEHTKRVEAGRERAGVGR